MLPVMNHYPRSPDPKFSLKKKSPQQAQKRKKFSAVSNRFSESEKPSNIEQYTNSGYTMDIERIYRLWVNYGSTSAKSLL